MILIDRAKLLMNGEKKMRLIDASQLPLDIEWSDVKNAPTIEAIPISFIEKLIEERIEQEQWELDTYGEYNQMAWVYSHLIEEWRNRK